MTKKIISRRSFLKSTAATSLALPYICTAYSPAAPASDKITIGMIGVGRQGISSNIKAFLSMPDVRVVSVCDVDSWRQDNAVNAVNKYYGKNNKTGKAKGCRAYSDFRELLAQKDIDAVMISTPDHWHAIMSIMAVKAGKDVSCEKPITMTIEEGRIISDTVKRYNKVFRTDSEFRSESNFHRAAELVVNGRIGKIHTIKTGVPAGDIACGNEPDMAVPPDLNYDMWLGPAPVAAYTEKRVHPPRSYGRSGWMRVRDYCDGMVTNWGTHLNDIAQWGNGTERSGPVEVEGHGEYPKEGLWDVLLNFDIKYKFANGVKMTYKTDQPYTRFEGTKGWVHADYPDKITASSDEILNSVIKPEEIHFPLKCEKRDFIDAVKTRGNTLEDAEVGHRTTSLCHLGHIAIQLGRKLQWNPDKEIFINDAQANRMLSKSYRMPWKL
ncbi:MAG: Gfo/Idh/MocA family oxidoreductase [Planctomycetes bacterium]|nr:Gfo/Idh/MocA family oxidoreductase [Planctomycetota bacterium]